MDKFQSNLYYTTIDTPIGLMITCATKRGICVLEFSKSEDIGSWIQELEKKLGTKLIETRHVFLTQLQKELKEYFHGSRKEFTVPLDLIGTDFQKEVWNALLEIPFGKTRSYTQQSLVLDNPKGIRAIASANGQNKIAIVIPCHRVIGQDGSLTGYAGGLKRKKWLLDHEAKYSGRAIQGELLF